MGSFGSGPGTRRRGDHQRAGGSAPHRRRDTGLARRVSPSLLPLFPQGILFDRLCREASSPVECVDRSDHDGDNYQYPGDVGEARPNGNCLRRGDDGEDALLVTHLHRVDALGLGRDLESHRGGCSSRECAILRLLDRTVEL